MAGPGTGASRPAARRIRKSRLRHSAAAAAAPWLAALALWAAEPAAGQTAEPDDPVVSAAGEVYVGEEVDAGDRRREVPGRGTRTVRAALRSPLEPTDIVELPPVGPDEGRPTGQRATRTVEGDRPEPEPEQIGFGRDVPAHLGVNESRLAWVSLAEGGRAATLALRSPGAAALRVRFDFDVAPADLELRFYSPLDRAGAVGPVGAAELLADRPEGGTHGRYWSPTVHGDTLAVEFHLPGPAKLSFTVAAVSHLEVSPLDIADLGDASSCTIDLACRPDDISDIVMRSVTKYILTRSSGRSSGCTAQLVSDLHPETQTPYLLTARHCVGNQAEASSMEFYWRFERAGCDAEELHADYERTPGGAFLLNSETHRGGTDYALLRMKQAPPAGVGMAGWTTATVVPDTRVVGVSHPRLDVKKISIGHVLRHESWINDPHETHIVLRLSHGAVQGGSSGSGLWTRTDNGDYLLGVLTGGTRGCTQQRLYYGRMELFYPKVRPWLGSVAPIRFALLDAASGAELLELAPDATLDLSATEADSFNILAQQLAVDLAGAMELELAGPQSASRTSEARPHTLYGEGGGGGLPPGDYTVTARTGPAGAPGTNERSVAFSVTGDADDDDFRLTGLTVATTGGERVADLTADAVVDLARYPEDAVYDIRAQSAGTAPVGSVVFRLTGTGDASETDSTAPFALRGPLPAGSYRITATPYPEAAGGGTAGTALEVDFTVVRASPVTGFTLVDTSGQRPADLTAIADGATLDLSSFTAFEKGADDYAIRAEVGDASAVGSVRLELSGPISASRTEDAPPPFTLYGDREQPQSNGTTVVMYNGYVLPDGDYRLRAVAYTGRGGSGTALPAFEIGFSVTGSYDPERSPIYELVLVDASGDAPDEDLTAIEDGATLDVASFDSFWFTIRARVWDSLGGNAVRSVGFGLTGPVSKTRSDSEAPYALLGDDGGGNYYGLRLPNGDYRLTATPYTGRDRTGTALTALEIGFSVTGGAVPLTGFTLVDASGGAPDEDVTAIADGATLDLSAFEQNWFNIRANAGDAAGDVGSVRLELSGALSMSRMENAPAPFALKGDNRRGDYYGERLADGDYRIEATAFPRADGRGDAIATIATSFTVTGGYDPGVTPLTGFTLVNAAGEAPDEDVTAIADGATLDLSAFEENWFNIRADVPNGRTAASVRLELTGPVTASRTENGRPFALKGDDGDGDYRGMRLTNGAYRIKATAYTRRNRNGAALPPLEASFTVTDGDEAEASPVTGFTLVDAVGGPPDPDLTAITDGATLDLSPYVTGRYNIRADVAEGAAIGSMRLQLTGPVSEGRTENAPAPYSVKGDNGDDYGAMDLPNGDYTITATPYAGRNGTGDALTATAVDFTVTGSFDADSSPVTGFTLVDASGEPPDPDLGAITDGATLGLSSYETNAFNIRADVAAAPAIGSIRLELDGPASVSRTENAPPPYAVRGDDGDGDYWSMRLPNGDYTITATAYTGEDRSGEALPAVAVDFTVTGSFEPDASPVVGFTLVDASGDAPDEDLTTITDGATLDLSSVESDWFSIRADVDVDGGRGVRSMRMFLTGPVSRTRVENGPPPYAIRGDDHDGDYYGMALPNGDYRIRAVPYDGSYTTGTAMPALEIAFTVTGSYDQDANPLTGFTLVHAGGGLPDEDAMGIADDATLDIASYEPNWFAIRADVDALLAPGVGSVWLELEGPVSRAVRENHPPFAINGAGEDGDYYGVRLANGDYRVMATAYARDGLLGETLGSATLAFTVVGGVDASAEPLTGFTLVDAGTDQDVAAVTDGATLDVAELGGAATKFTFRADAAEDAVIGSVLVELSGPGTFTPAEHGSPPYSLHRESDGDYRGAYLPNGDYRLTATPYTGRNLSGDPLPVIEADFTVTGSYDADVSPVTGFTLVDSAGEPPDPDLTEIADGATLDLSSYDTSDFNIRADVAAVPPVGSMRLELAGPVSRGRTENAPAPYTVRGDRDGNYWSMQLPNGDYTITATAYTGRNRSGDALLAAAADFTVTGSYDADASPVTGFTLVDSAGEPPDPDLTAIADGATLDLSSYDTSDFNIRADVAAVPPIGSMRLELAGPVSRGRTENAPAPYTVRGDRDGNYWSMQLPNGDYTITATAYTGEDLSGDALPAVAAGFTVTRSDGGDGDGSTTPVTGFTLVHADGDPPDPDVSAIADGATLDISSFDRNWFNIRANVEYGWGVRSMRLELAGPVSATRTENGPPPYAVKGDNGDGNYYGLRLADGDYTITATPYDDEDLDGQRLPAATVRFSVTGEDGPGGSDATSPVTGFTLVHAAGDPPDPDVSAIADGATLDLSAFEPNWFNIRADIDANRGVGSVAFVLTGAASETKTDSDPPFALKRDEGDGDYYGMELPDGDYGLTATPYTGRSESGDALPSREVRFSVTRSGDNGGGTPSSITGFTLVDAAGDPPDPDLTAIADGATLDLSAYATDGFNIRADVTGSGIRSMRLELAGPVSRSRTENAPAPYTVRGDRDDNYWVMALANGDYTITATAYAGRDLSGDVLSTLEVDFTVTGSYDADVSPVTGFTLVDSAGGPPDPDLAAITDGATLDLGRYATKEFNIRADLAAMPPIRSMRLELSGPVDRERLEDAPAPYTLWGEDDGDYGSTRLLNGDYTITATPYTGRDGSGDALPAFEIDFTVTGSRSPVTRFTLIHAAGAAPDPDVGPIIDGGSIDVSSYADNNFTIRAEVDDDDVDIMVRLELRGPAGRSHLKTEAPFALHDDDGDGDYDGMELPNGKYRIKARPYALTGPVGAMPTLTVDFSITD